MRFSTIVIGLVAPIALAFPFVANKRDSNKGVVVRDVFHYATVIVTVTPTPVDLTAYEEYGFGFRRHRHTISRQGSPTPTVHFDVLPTPESPALLASDTKVLVTPKLDTSFLAKIFPVTTFPEHVPFQTTTVTPIIIDGEASITNAASSTSISTSGEISTTEVATSTLINTAVEVVTTGTATFTSSGTSKELLTTEAASSTPLTTSNGSFTVETALSTTINNSEGVFSIETASSTPTSTSVAPPQQSSSIIDASEAAEAAAEDALPRTYVPNLDPTSDIYKGLTLQHHNIHRRNHSAVDVTWNDTLAGYAETIAKSCIWGHNLSPGGGGYGQNIAGGYPPGNITTILTNGFYNQELPLYPEFGTNNPNTTLFEKWGHFSQLVWKLTNSVGCYTALCSPLGADSLECRPDGTSFLTGLPCGNGGVPAVFTVCNYYPAGNVGGEYTNVGAPLNGPKVFVNEFGVQGL